MTTPPDTWIAAYLDEALEPAQHEAFVRWLKSDVRHVRLLVEHSLLDGALREVVRTDDSLRAAAPDRPAQITAFPAGQPVEKRWPLAGWKTWGTLAAGFAVLVASFVGWLALRPDTPRLAAVEGRVRVVRDGRGLPAENGLRLRAGDVIVTEARAGARIQFGREDTWIEMVDQSEIVVEAFASAKEIRLRHGGFEAQVAPQPKDHPMVCRTPLGRATVLGTRLSLSATRKISRLEVFKGAVNWDGETHGSTFEVKSGQFAQADAAAGLRVESLWQGDRLEAESLLMDDVSRAGDPVRISRYASGRRERHIRWRSSDRARTIYVPVSAPGTYLLHVGIVRANTGVFRFSSGGVPIGRAYDSFGQNYETSAEFTLGTVHFDSAGNQPLQIELTGLNPAATVRNLWLDYLRLTPVRETLATGWEPPPRSFSVQSGGELVAPPTALQSDPRRPGMATDRVTLLADPAHGRLRLSAQGGFTYVPDAGFSGDDTFVYQVSDGHVHSQPAKATITVGAAQPQMDVSWTAAPPVLDGQIDAAWTRATPQPITRLLEGRADGATDFSAAVRALWDEHRLYLLVEVLDDFKQPGSKAIERWHRDAVEIYLDGRNQKRPRWETEEVGFRIAYGTGAIETIRRSASLEKIVAAQSDTAHGYIVELAIPWASIGRTEVAPGALVGLEVHVLDEDDGGERDTVLGWFNTRDLAHLIPATFGTIRLVRSASVEPTPGPP